MTSNDVYSRHARHAVGEHLARTMRVKVSSTDFSCFPALQRPSLDQEDILRRRVGERPHARQGKPRRPPANIRVLRFSFLAREQWWRRP